MPRSTWNFPWTFTSSRGPLGLKHTLEGQFPWVQDSGFTAPLSVPQAHGHLDCHWCYLCSSFLLSNLPLLSGNYQRFFSEGKDAPRAQLTPVWHLLTKQISGSGLPFWGPGMNVGAGRSSCFPLLTQDSFWTLRVTSPGSHPVPHTGVPREGPESPGPVTCPSYRTPLPHHRAQPRPRPQPLFKTAFTVFTLVCV